jgi:predicted SAM-dependent methyltransferase
MKKRVEKKTGIMLDVGAGKSNRPGFTNMDKRKLPGVDIVHDFEKFPWPIKSESVITAVASHVVEHVKPWLMLKWMDEVWRVMKVGGQFAISMPYGYSSGFSDPTHCNACK